MTTVGDRRPAHVAEWYGGHGFAKPLMRRHDEVSAHDQPTPTIGDAASLLAGREGYYSVESHAADREVVDRAWTLEAEIR